DDNLLRRYLFCPHLDSVPVEQNCAGLVDKCAGILEPLAVEAFEPGDFLFLVGDERRPVERRLADGPAITGGIGKMLGKLRGIDVELLRHAAADDAGAAEAVFLGDRDPLAEGGCDPRRAYAARPTADDKEIEVECRHVLPRLQS